VPPFARVEVIAGAPSQVKDIPRLGLEIGRADTAGLCLDTPSVSKRHARFFWEGEDLLVADLGSTNKIHRDGQLIDLPTMVQDGDELVLGEVLLRISIEQTGYGYPMTELAETDKILSSRPDDTNPVDRRAAELLPVVESFFHARDFRELGQRVVESVKKNMSTSRVALIEIEEKTQRFRLLGIEGATDPTFVSRTVVGEAARRGIALHQLGAMGRPTAPSLLNARATSAVAALLRCRGDKVRVLYIDTLTEEMKRVPPLSWVQAFELQIFASYAASAFDALQTQKEVADERVRFEGLRRHFSPAVVEQLALLRNPEKEVTAPRHLPAAVLFADLAGFNALTERWRSHPDSLISVLDLWFEAGSRAVFGHGGTLDKFVGDSIMAVFGAPFPLRDATQAAVRCARDMQRLGGQLDAETGAGLQVTIGIESGQVMACSVGSRRRHDFTVIGDAVASAARLQEAAPEGSIVVGERAAAELASVVKLEDLDGRGKIFRVV
jgi:adenylate cyclase